MQKRIQKLMVAILDVTVDFQGITNVEFLAGKAEDVLVEVLKQKKLTDRVVAVV